MERANSRLIAALVRWAQLPCDIITTTLLLPIIGSGGISPFTILYGIAILGAAALLPPQGIYAIGLVATRAVRPAAAEDAGAARNSEGCCRVLPGPARRRWRNASRRRSPPFPL